MVMSPEKTAKAYLDSLPQDRRAAIEAVRLVILKRMPRGFEEGMQFGMIGYYIPLSSETTVHPTRPERRDVAGGNR